MKNLDFENLLIYSKIVMVHMTCKRTTNAKEDLAYVVNKFLKAEPLDPLAIRSSIHSHTQTVSPDKRHIQVCFLYMENFQLLSYM